MNTKEQFSRTELLIGKDGLNKLQSAHVLVVGLGGVGGYAVEQLVRAGIGKLTLADADSINESNINRQIIALNSTVGKAKTECIAERMYDINPNVELILHHKYFTEEDFADLLKDADFDYVIDAIDTLAPKVALILETVKSGIPLISSMGAGAKLDPSQVKIVDISKTYNDGLARMIRKRIHRQGIRKGFKAVFSPEPVVGKIVYEASQNKKTNLGTISYMPAIFGLHTASQVIRDLIRTDT